MLRNKTHLHFGCLVSLRLQQKGDHYLTSDGFIQKSVIAQDYSSASDGSKNLDFLDSVFQVLPLYQYQYQQEIQRQLDDFYRKETQKFEQDISSRDDDSSVRDQEEKRIKENQKFEQNFEKQERQLQAMSLDLNRELAQNDLKFTKNKNLNIAYGEKFQLQHYRSKKYLCLSNLSYDDSFQSTISLQLENNPSEMTQFKFVSAYKHQVDLSKDVSFDAHVFLAIDTEKEGYIYYLNSDPKRQQTNPRAKEMDKVQEITFLKERKSDFYFKPIKQTVFELKLYCECIEDDKTTVTQEDISTLTYGDIVWITENQSESQLECVDTIEDETMKGSKLLSKYQSLSQYAVATSKDEYESKQKILQQIQQKNNIFLSLIFKRMKSSELKNTRGLWKIESPFIDKGGPISLKSEIRLKNIRNGLYLAFVSESSLEDDRQQTSFFNDNQFMQMNENKPKKQKVSIVEMHLHDVHDQSATLFQLIRKDDSSVTTANNEFLYEYLYDIRHVQTQQYLGQMYKKDFPSQQDMYFQNSHKNQSNQNQGQKGVAGGSNYLNPNNSNNNLQLKQDQSSQMSYSSIGENMISVDQDEDQSDDGDDYQKKALAAVVTMFETDSKEFIKLYKAPHEDVWEILFLLSCIPQLQKGINLLKYVQEQIIDSINNIFDNPIIARKVKTNQAKEGKFKCNIKRQRLLREQGVLRYITIAIKYLFQDNNQPFKQALLKEKLLEQLFKLPDTEASLLNQQLMESKVNRMPIIDTKNDDPENTQLQMKVTKLFKGLTKIARGCYQLIFQICNQNSDNQLQAFKYIKVYKNHIGFNLGAESCIIAILQDNEDLLLSQNFADITKMPDDLEIEQSSFRNSQMLLVDNQDDGLMFARKQQKKEVQVREENKLINIIFEQYKIVCSIDRSQRGQQYQIIDLLICLCKNGQESLTINQSSICDLIFNSPNGKKQLYYSFFIKIQPIATQIFIENLLNDTSDKLELLNFYATGMNDKDQNSIFNKRKFVQKLIQLYAHLCAGRNYNCIEKVRGILPFESIKNYLWDDRGYEILSALISIADCVYIDKKPQYERFIPDLVHSIEVENRPEQQESIYEEDEIYIQNENNKKQIRFNPEIEMTNYNDHSVQVHNAQIKLNQEDKYIRYYLKTNVFDIVTKYIERCKYNSQTRNKPLTLNTIELVRKFIVFDMFKLTSKTRQQDIYQQFLTTLRLGMDESLEVRKQEVIEVKPKSLMSKIKSFLTGKDTSSKKKVHFAAESKEANQPTTTKNRFTKQRIPRKSVNDTLQRENFSNLYRRQIQNPNDDSRESVITEKSSRQTNIDIKKKILEIFLIYIDLKINNQIDKIIQHIRSSNNKKKSVSEEVIYQHMREQQTIEAIFPKIELPLAKILSLNTKSNKGGIIAMIKDIFMQLKGEKEEVKQRKDDDDGEYPSLNRFLKDSTSLNHDYDKKITEKSEQLLLCLLDIFLLNSDYQLNCLVLNVLFKNFSLGKQTIKVSKNLIIISDEEEIIIDQTIEKTIKDFSFMCETSETWFVHASRLKLLNNQEWVRQNPEEFQVLLNQKEEVNKSLQQINNLNELMFTSSVKEALIPNMRKNQGEQRQIRMTRQFMMKNANAQKLIMDMLKDNIHILEEITEFDHKCQITKVFQNCFLFLKNFCLRDNKINKKELYKDIKFFTRFTKYVDVGQIDLINEIYEDNYKACTEVDDDIIRLYLSKICYPLSSKGFGGRNLRYLRFIQNIMFFKKLKMPIPNNIWKVVQNIQITMNSERILRFLFMKKNDYYDRQRGISDSPQIYQGPYVFDLEIPQNVVLQVTDNLMNYIFEDDFFFNQPFLYQAAILNTLLDIIKETEGKSTFLKNIMKKYLPCDYILFFLQKQDYFLLKESNKNKLVLHLKKPLCQILQLLYLDSDSLQNSQKQIIENDNTEKFITNEVDKIEKQVLSSNYQVPDQSANPNMPNINIGSYSVMGGMQKSINPSERGYFKAKHEGIEEAPRSQNDSSFLYENRMYETLARKLDSSEFDHVTWLVGYSLPVMNSIFEICHKLNINKYSVQIDRLKELLKAYNIEDKIKNNRNFKATNIEQILQDTKRHIERQDISMRSQSSRFTQPQSLFTQKTMMGLDDDLEQFVSLPLQNILSGKGGTFSEDKYPKIFLLNMLIMDEIRDQIDLEKLSLIQAMQKIDKALIDEKDEKISRIFPRFTWFLKIVFNQYTINKGWDEYRLLVDIMRILILLLENPMDKEEVDYLDKTEEFGIERSVYLDNEISKKREKYQDLFANHNLPKYLLEMLCNKDIDFKMHHQSVKLRRTIFGLLNSLLQGGNAKVQNQIYQFFTQNQNSFVFFDMISGMIDDEITDQLNVSIYDEIEQDLESIEFVYRAKDKFLDISDILKTIQLLCKKNFSKNQHYIRYQSNSRNSINLIEKVSNLFDFVIRNHNDPDKLNIDYTSLSRANQILSTLIESVQGPVLENQLEIIQSKILKSISDLLSYFHFIDLLLIIKYFYKNNQEQENIEIFREKNTKKAQQHGKSQLTKDKNIKLFDNKKQIQEKLIQNISHLSKRFSDKVAEKFFKRNENWMISKLKNKCALFLESLLEGNQDSAILNKIMTEIPQVVLSENLGIVYGKLSKAGIPNVFNEKLLKMSFQTIEEINKMKEQQKRERHGIVIETGFRIYHLLALYHKENEKNVSKVNKLKEDVEEQETFQKKEYIIEGYEYFKKNSLHLEINVNSKFYWLFFPKLPACGIEIQHIIQKYEEKYDRVSTKSKTRDLLKQSQNIIIEIQHDYEINYSDKEKLFDDVEEPDDGLDILKVTQVSGQVVNKLWDLVKKFVIKNSHKLQTASFYIAMFSNLVILFSFKNFHSFLSLDLSLAANSTQSDFYDDQDSTPSFSLSFNPVSFFVSLLQVIQIIQVVFNAFVFIAFLFRDLSYFEKKVKMEKKDDDNVISNPFIVDILQKLLRGMYGVVINYIKKIISYKRIFWSLLSEKYLDFTLIVGAFLSLFNPVITSLLMLDAFRRNPSLKNILKSLYIARYQLFLTLVLFIVLTYIFAMIVYYFFWDNLANQCNSLWVCFLYIFDMTFKNNAGYVSGQQDFSDNWQVGILDIQQLLYVFIIVIIIGEIIAGIIIDTLANLREEDAAKKEDKEKFCFICGQNRDYLDRKAGGWSQHIEEDHNPMNYVFVIMYLQFKRRQDYTGFENVISQQVQKQEIGWFPILDFITEQDGLEEKQMLEKKKQDLKELEDQVHIEYKEQNEKNIKENAIASLDILTRKIDSLQSKLNQEEESDSDEEFNY